MVMGQEERKNKAKLEKTQIQMASTSNEYEAAIKCLEETTGRWNKDWKAACDVCANPFTTLCITHCYRNSKTLKKSVSTSLRAASGSSPTLLPRSASATTA